MEEKEETKMINRVEKFYEKSRKLMDAIYGYIDGDLSRNDTITSIASCKDAIALIEKGLKGK